MSGRANWHDVISPGNSYYEFKGLTEGAQSQALKLGQKALAKKDRLKGS
jgi:hypothetical protein